MNCELCGKECELLRVVVENTELNVCESCSCFGKVIGRARPVVQEERRKVIAKRQEKEAVELIVPDFGPMVKAAREKKGLKQEEVARLISEKASLLHNIETGKHEPGIELARKLERFFKIKLVEQQEDIIEQKKARKDGEITLGDFVKVKKR